MLGVAHEERGVALSCDPHHQRVVVGVLQRTEAGTRGEHLDRRVAVRARSAAEIVGPTDGDAPRTQAFDHRAVRGPRPLGLALPGVPELAHRELRQRAHQPEKVIGMRMGQHHDVHVIAPPRPQRRQEHADARIHR